MYANLSKYVINDNDTLLENIDAFRNTNCQSLLETDIENLSTIVENNFEDLMKLLIDFESVGSGWFLTGIYHLDLNIATYAPFPGTSYMALPHRLNKKHCCINVKNHDDKCFIWSILAQLFPARHNRHRVIHYKKFENMIKMGSLSHPIKLNDVPIFERLNNLSINVFGYDTKTDIIFPAYISKHRQLNDKRNIDLLLLRQSHKSHYVLIYNFNKFLGSHNYHKRRFCRYCLQGFYKLSSIENHTLFCKNFKCQRTKLPIMGKNDLLRYKDFSKELQHQCVIYADFESILMDIHRCMPNPNLSSTTIVSEHVLCGFAFVVIVKGNIYTYRLYRGQNAMVRFLEELTSLEQELLNIITKYAPLNMTEVDMANFQNATHCHLCNGIFKKGELKVKNHDHYSGFFLGASHNECNLQYRIKKRIPIFFHNSKNYDSHMLIKMMSKTGDPIRIIPSSFEKYMCIEFRKFTFLDSYQFLPSSLDTLTKNLMQSGRENFKILKQYFGSKYILFLRKLPYCYSYVKNFHIFDEINLPPIEAFYNDLTEKSINLEDYNFTRELWDEMSIKNMGEFHDIYLISDTLLLADIMENYRHVCLEEFQLDPVHFVSGPSLSWHACLKLTNIEIQLITDSTIHDYIESGLRGGLSVICHRYARANNTRIKNYDSTKEACTLAYYDCNALYARAMCEAMPHSGFKLLSETEIQQFDINKEAENPDIGYILCVDLIYPKKYHDLHNDLPLAPHKMSIDNSMLSPYSKLLKSKLGRTETKSAPKLVATFLPRKYYTTHIRNLKFYLRWMHLERIHSIIAFKQSPWLATYIELNNGKRKLAKTAFEKSLRKGLNNQIFGKSCENVRNYKEIKLANSKVKAKKLLSKINVKSWKIFDSDLVAVHLNPLEINLNKPLFLGFCVLEISKLIMYQFYYDVIKPAFGQNVRLLFTDTDSLFIRIAQNDITAFIKENEDKFDLSDYPESHPLHNMKNYKQMGCFKNEIGCEEIREFIGLKAKMYSILMDNHLQITKAKGVPQSVIRNKLRHEHYLKCLKEQQTFSHTFSTIRSQNHNIYTYKSTKKSLDPFDDKRYQINAIESLAYGHYKIQG